jgi:hypothetical protein
VKTFIFKVKWLLTSSKSMVTLMFSTMYNMYRGNPDEQGDYVRMDCDEKNT